MQTNNKISRLNSTLLTIHKIYQLIVAIDDENELLQKICAALIDGHSYKLARSYLFKKGSCNIHPAAQPDLTQSNPESITVIRDDYEYGCEPSEMAVKTGQPVIINDVASDERCRRWCDTALKNDIYGLIALPLIVSNKVIGILTVYAGRKDAFDAEEIDLLKGTVRDISLGIQKIRQQKEIRQTQLKYALVVENSNDNIIILQDGRMKFFNKNMHKQFGFQPEEYYDKPFLNFVAPSCREIVAERYRKRLAGQEVPTKYEMAILSKDNRSIPVEVNVSPIEYEGGPAIMVVARVITERKQAEEALRASEAKFRNLVENAAAGILITLIDGGIISANKAALEQLGFDSEKELKKRFAVELYVNAEDRKRLLEYLMENGVAKSYEVQWKRRDGTPFWVSLNVIPQTTRSGDMQLISICEDITRRKEMEQKLNQSYKQLQKNFKGISQTLAATVEMRDPYTAGHQIKVAELAREISLEIGFSKELAEQIYTAGLIHDIGKISVPAEILSKPGKLNDIEFALIKMHPQAGYDILKNIDFPYPLARWVLDHHELINGSGYPSGLKNDSISKEARILAVADLVEAMSSHRPYRAALGIEAAMAEIIQKKNILYDGQVVDACVRLFVEKGYKLE